MTTKTQKTAKELSLLLNGLINNTNEKIIMEAIISEAYHKGVDPVLLESIVRELSEKLEIQSYIDYIDDLYSESGSPNSGLTGLKVMLEALIDKKTARNTVLTIKKELRQYAQKETYKLEVGTNKTVVLDKTSKTIYKEQIKITENHDLTKYETVINAYPTEITVHDSPISDEPRNFTMKWQSKSSERKFLMRNHNLRDIENSLEDAGFVINPRELRGTIASVIQIAIDNKLATIKSEIDNPGFYYDEKQKKLICINYEVTEPSKKELLEAIEVLDDLGKWFSEHTTKLAHGIKWGLMSPFAYARKQLGLRTEWLYLFGRSGSGKTALGKIILYLWNHPVDDENEIAGPDFDTVYKAGVRLSTSTFPIIINEPAGAFNNDNVVELIKNAVDATSSRSRGEGRRLKTFQAFAIPIFTANQFIPDDDALLNRFNVINFAHDERKGDEEKKLFEKEFTFKQHKSSKLNKLKAISMYFANEFMGNVKLLEESWESVANELLSQLYYEVGSEMPMWLKEYCEIQTYEDLDEEETETIRSFILENINRESKKIQIWEEDNYRIKKDSPLSQGETKDRNDFKELVWDIANNNLIPWMIPHVGKDFKNYICLTIGFKNAVYKNTCLQYNLKSLSQLLEFDYKQVKLSGKNTKVIQILLSDFIDFIYPTVSDDNFEEVVEKSCEVVKKDEVT